MQLHTPLQCSNEPAKVLFEQLTSLFEDAKMHSRFPVTLLCQCCGVSSYYIDFLAHALSWSSGYAFVNVIRINDKHMYVEVQM